MMVHSEVRPFLCSYKGCEKGFKTETALAGHIRTHTGEKPYACTVPGCGQVGAIGPVTVCHLTLRWLGLD
jgi:hypothetical protein